MIEQVVNRFFETRRGNFIDKEIALTPSLVGMKIFDTPLIGIADARDPIFETFFKQEEIVYGQFMTPDLWLNTAKSVISIFLPYTDDVKKGNAANLKRPTMEWLHGRYEGQQFIIALSKYVQKAFEDQGYKCVVPGLSEQLKVNTGTHLVQDKKAQKYLTNKDFWSNWSERHVAFAAGLGTFGLSKNIITAKGSAGRLTSFITDADLKTTKRKYTQIYENCSLCGACIPNCPVNAIHRESGKHHTVCSRYLDWVAEHYKPRYACGKCQVSVPCQDCIPKKLEYD